MNGSCIPNGSIPAYEWNFGDVNPPVHAWAAWRVFRMEAALTGTPDIEFLERIFHKLMLNFTGWVNKQDVEGRNVFQGGFLGLDNIGCSTAARNCPWPACIDQSDGTVLDGDVCAEHDAHFAGTRAYPQPCL